MWFPEGLGLVGQLKSFVLRPHNKCWGAMVNFFWYEFPDFEKVNVYVSDVENNIITLETMFDL